MTDPLGNQTRYLYDGLNRLTQIQDALNGLTDFSYDPNGNLTRVADARQNATTYVPDDMDRLWKRTDPLGHPPEIYEYDGNGNLKVFTDRKGQTRRMDYDALDRLKLVTWHGGSTTSHTWDAGNRLRVIVDTPSGTITRDNCHDLDRLRHEGTPQGTVDYTYDAAGRRLTMTAQAVGQAPVTVTYDTYDEADRLKHLTQGTATVAMDYDDAGRRTSLTLPNGTVATYGYDPAGRLGSIAFTPGGTITYGYDGARRRKTVSGNWGRTGIPQPVTGTHYNANNQQDQWGGVAQVFDANGNLQVDAANNQYQWDVRDRLIGMSGQNTASFQYDPLGRRMSKTVNGTTTGFLYDGVNAVQELGAGGQVLATLLTGLGVDEYFTRTEGATRRTFLADALGSTVALADDTGNVRTSYTYEPFGTMTFTGQTSTNAFQYTGRENDGTGLYYYRARYYSPKVQRFVGEDPIGLEGGDSNVYAYTFNSPLNYNDPTGLIPASCGNAVMAGLIDPGPPVLGGRKSVVFAGLGWGAFPAWSGPIIGLGAGGCAKGS